MSWIAPFNSVVGRKQDKYVIWELIYKFWISYEFYKWTIESYELIGI